MPRQTCTLSCLAVVALACPRLEADSLTLGQFASSADTLTVIVDFDRAQFAAVEDSIRVYWTAFPDIHAVRFMSAAEAARDSLADNGQAGAVLYGTLDARADNPVFGAFGGTWLEPLQQEAPRLQSEDETGIIAVGRNPFARGFIGVFAAANADFLPAMHSYYDGSQSLVIIYHGRVEQRALYDTEFRKMLTEIAGDEALEDVDVFFDTIEQAHPQPLLHLSPESYLELKRGMSKRLGLEDAGGVATGADHAASLPEIFSGRVAYCGNHSRHQSSRRSSTRRH